MRVTVSVPATTANVGPGFDSIGMALSMRNTLAAETTGEPPGALYIAADGAASDAERVPTDKTNLIYRVIRAFYHGVGLGEPPGLRLTQTDAIPLTRGLGSSAACVVAGLCAANALSGANLSWEEIARRASVIEGHPDNAFPAALGGLIVAASDGKRIEYVRADKLPGLGVTALIPDFTLPTDEARRILPARYPQEDAVFNVSRAALLAAALFSGDWEKLSFAVDDRLHQPYRKPLIPGYDDITRMCREAGSLASFLSGAGPTVIALHDSPGFADRIAPPDGWRAEALSPDFEGAVVSIE
ncbi:MAG: homoserine kinase [Clostridiales bacterium]|jgi:homoserine kinase|nr:homoserine kinase [Clostridiales bacterium]